MIKPIRVPSSFPTIQLITATAVAENAGVGVAVSASGTDQSTGEVNWNRPYYCERLKRGAALFRDAALDVASS